MAGFGMKKSLNFEKERFMDEKEFEEQLHALSERFLSKTLTLEEKTNYTESLFESIKYINEYGQEYWYARELKDLKLSRYD